MKKHLSLLLLVSLFTLSSCHKYEDGPLFSFKSAKARLTYDWKLTQAFKNEVDTVTGQQHFGVNFNSNESVIFTDTTFDGANVQLATNRDGSWQFTESAENIGMVLNEANGSKQIKVWYILRLDDQLWVREQIGKDYFEYHFSHR